MLNEERLVNILSSEKLTNYIETHLHDDTHQLAFSKSDLDQEEQACALDQIYLLQKIRKKCPKAYAKRFFLTRKGSQQCSSEALANFKAKLFKPYSSLLDLSFGTGIDSLAFATTGSAVEAIEHDEKRFNFGIANLEKEKSLEMSLIKSDGIKHLKNSDKFYDIIYSDPDRRHKDGKRKKGWMDLSPSVQKTIESSNGRCRKLLIKLSPLLELNDFLRHNPNCSELHYISLNYEMKEVLAVFDKDLIELSPSTKLIIHEVNFPKNSYSYKYSNITKSRSSDVAANYIYQLWPGFSASRTLGLVLEELGLTLLGNSETLSCSKELVKAPGRTYKVLRQCNYKELKSTLEELNISETALHSRSIGIRGEELRKKLKLKESERYEVFLVKDKKNRSLAFLTERIK